MAFWALRSFAAETIFIALVIWRVELTDFILLRISFKLAREFGRFFYVNKKTNFAKENRSMEKFVFLILSVFI